MRGTVREGPLSCAQEALWFIERLHAEAIASGAPRAPTAARMEATNDA
ncbi:MAG: hypothetical protein M9885_13060 [Burkholderiaceae bacterium]|nr:hypothetical protein [Burkholderiaceae bacterium]